MALFPLELPELEQVYPLEPLEFDLEIEQVKHLTRIPLARPRGRPRAGVEYCIPIAVKHWTPPTRRLRDAEYINGKRILHRPNGIRTCAVTPPQGYDRAYCHIKLCAGADNTCLDVAVPITQQIDGRTAPQTKFERHIAARRPQVLFGRNKKGECDVIKPRLDHYCARHRFSSSEWVYSGRRYRIEVARRPLSAIRHLCAEGGCGRTVPEERESLCREHRR